ncbi:MAG: hypothetical protein OEM38_07005 [Gammaproteobacteria bacterium]|nr:hypothetical protein [Gammaproteobacteria bacterium]
MEIRYNPYSRIPALRGDVKTNTIFPVEVKSTPPEDSSVTISSAAKNRLAIEEDRQRLYSMLNSGGSSAGRKYMKGVIDRLMSEPGYQSSSENPRTMKEEKQLIDSNPEYADLMAKRYATSANLIMTKSGAAQWQGNHTENIGKYDQVENLYTDDSLGKMDVVYREHRTQIYNQMKSEGAEGKDIVKAIMEYNATLPSEYLKRTGLNVVVSEMLKEDST